MGEYTTSIMHNVAVCMNVIYMFSLYTRSMMLVICARGLMAPQPRL